jgi:dihydroflavonol-4-reductase
MTKVLVAGGLGFVRSRCILQLLQQGYEVRTTVRSLDREKGVRAMLKEGGMEPVNRLSFVAAITSAQPSATSCLGAFWTSVS